MPVMLILTGLFLTIALAVVAAGRVYLRSRDLAEASPATGPSSGSAAVPEMLAQLGQRVRRPSTRTEQTRKMLFRAGYRAPRDLHVFYGIQVFGSMLTAGLFAALAAGFGRDATMAWLCGLGFGFLIPPRVLDWQVRSRAHRIRSAVASALDLMVLSLEAGQTLDLALQDAAGALNQVFPDLSSELTFCILEMRAGTSRPDALRRLAERCGEEEVKKVTGILIDGERFGTSLGPALRAHARYLRIRSRQKAQEATRKAGVKLVLPIFFLIFPSVMVVTLGPAYLQMRNFLDSFVK